MHQTIVYRVLLPYIYSKLLQWVASFDRPSAFLATLLILYFFTITMWPNDEMNLLKYISIQNTLAA